MVYITGDTHGAFDINKINPRESEMMRLLKEGDYLIICGDFGCIWDGGSSDRFWLNWLESLPWTTLFVDGNHENFDVLYSYPQTTWHGGLVRKIRSNIYHLQRGQVFDIDGFSFFTMGGAASHDQPFRQEFKNWWRYELPNWQEVSQAEENLERHNWKVDYVVSHELFVSHPMSHTYQYDMSRYGEEYANIQEVLETIRKKLDYKVWFTGHYHDDFIFYDNGRPVISLFNKVVELEHIPFDTLRIIEPNKEEH